MFKGRSHSKQDESNWLTVSDLMAGLMMVFLFISIMYMRSAIVERDKIKDIIVAWDKTNEAVFEDLSQEFESDLEKWNASLDKETLTMRFEEPEVLFTKGEVDLKLKFKKILSDFYPRYIATLDKYAHCEERELENQGCIEAIRIEGHTSSEWNQGDSDQKAYFENMALSQGRTRTVLKYCDTLPSVKEIAWVRKKIAAVGFSSSHLIMLKGSEQEDKERSRRVEFRVKTTVEKQLMRVIRP
ncbi:MAG: hypothetical protein R8M38_03700 [Mariprofundaceae bacterium]